MSLRLVSSTVMLLAVVAATPACRKSAEEQRRQSAEATSEAEQKAQEATLTSATLETKEEAAEAKDDALREHAEAITAVRREQVDYRTKLQAAIDTLDRELAEMRTARTKGRSTGGPGHVKALEGRRETLKQHLDALDRTTDPEWAALKAKIDRDLRSGDVHVEPRSDRPRGEYRHVPGAP